ncbi:hypothetical protein ABTH41_19990, partial [Acinetobacter baumannii]
RRLSCAMGETIDLTGGTFNRVQASGSAHLSQDCDSVQCGKDRNTQLIAVKSRDLKRMNPDSAHSLRNLLP